MVLLVKTYVPIVGNTLNTDLQIIIKCSNIIIINLKIDFYFITSLKFLYFSS